MLLCVSTQLKAIKAAAKPKLEHWIAEIKVVEPLWDFRLKQKPPVDEMKVALIEWSSKRWGIKVEDSFFPKELMVKRNQRRGIVTKTSAAVKVEKEIPSIFSFREKADEMVFVSLLLPCIVPSHSLDYQQIRRLISPRYLPAAPWGNGHHRCRHQPYLITKPNTLHLLSRESLR